MESTLFVLSTLTEETASSQSILFAFFGLFVWEIFQTWDVEYNVLVAGSFRQFPLLQFVICRLFAFGTLLGLAIWHANRHEIGCKALYQFVSFGSDMTITMALGLLTTNTITMCNDLPLVKIPLLCLCIISAASLFLQTFIASPGQWDILSESCVRVAAEGTRNLAIRHAAFFVPFGVSLILLVVAFVSVLGRPRQASVPVTGYLFIDNGLMYYIAVVVMLAFPAILNAANPDTDVDGIAVVPAFVLSAIAAMRLTRSHDQTGTSRPQRRATATGDIFIHTASFVATDPGSLPTTRGGNRIGAPSRHGRMLPIQPSALVAEPISPCATPLPIQKDEESIIGHDDAGDKRRWSKDSNVTKELSIKFAHQ